MGFPLVDPRGDAQPIGTSIEEARLRRLKSAVRHEQAVASETFPDDYDPKKARQLRTRIADAAKRLNEPRENRLDPAAEDGSPLLTENQLKKRTLTNLYNDRPTWLELAHLELDRAVLAAYGRPEERAEELQPNRDERGKVNPVLGVVDPAIEQELLSRLLPLNPAMSTAQE